MPVKRQKSFIKLRRSSQTSMKSKNCKNEEAGEVVPVTGRTSSVTQRDPVKVNRGGETTDKAKLIKTQSVRMSRLAVERVINYGTMSPVLEDLRSPKNKLIKPQTSMTQRKSREDDTDDQVSERSNV